MKTFKPARYSNQELEFFKEHMGEPPVVALSKPLGPGVNPAAAREVLNAVYELEELRKHRDQEWVGIDAIKAQIDLFLEMQARDQSFHKQGGPRHSSTHQWDAKGRPYLYGIGSDAGEVHTYIGNDGERRSLNLDMIPSGFGKFQAPWTKKTVVALPNDLVEDSTKGFVQCPLCGFAQNYNPDSQSSRSLARARVFKHMKEVKGTTAEQHRELHTHISGS